MKVKDLIVRLQQFDPELVVFIDGYEGGIEEVESTNEHTIALNCNEDWYYGSHEIVNEFAQHEGKERVQGVYIG